MQIEIYGNFGGERNAGPHLSAAVDTSQVFRIQLHGISEREKRDDDPRAARKLKYKYGNRHFRAAGYYVSTAGLQEKALRKDIQEQKKQDQVEDKVSTKEYEPPFKDNAR